MKIYRWLSKTQLQRYKSIFLVKKKRIDKELDALDLF